MAEARLSLVLAMARELLDAIPRSASSSSSTDQHRRMARIEEDLEYLTRLLPRISAVLRDAEKREVRDESVKLWLTELEDVAYHAEDVLDEYQYEFLQAQVEGRAAATEASRKRKFVEVCGGSASSSSSLLTKVPIPDGMADRIREIRSRFDEISRDREALRLREEDGETRPRATYPPPTGHLIDESAVYGRERDKKKLIDLLLSENKENTLSVIPIVGTGGIGKTTLAQLIYNDPLVEQHFNLRGWVCVSEDFDVVRLTKAIIESITERSCGLTELSPLQKSLRKELDGKKVLLVLDDVWNERQRDWESLQVPFLGGAVSIIVTTRNLSVAEVMQTVLHPCRPGYLAEDQCWLLFQRYAFRGRDPSEYPTLVEIGKQIVKRCRGLPLAVKTLGGLLQYESDEYSWENILQSDLWQLHNDGGNGILAALRLSYNWMPAYLKPCFLYLSMYPKDHRYEKDEVVELWIANGYIQHRGSMTMEDVGKEYIDDLLKRSIIEANWGHNDFFVMHDMVHDLARSISKKRCLSIGFGEKLCDGSDRVQHLWVGCRGYEILFYASIQSPDPSQHEETSDSLCHNRMVLRTLLAPVIFYEMCGLSLMIQWTIRLRALHLEYRLYDAELDGLPDWIGCLKHLRYLSISNSCLQRLPDSVCLLYNLQILKLVMPNLKELPRDIGNLINLHTLYCRNCCIRELPVGIGDLKNQCYLFLDGYPGRKEMMDDYSVCIPSGFGKLTNLRRLGGNFSARTKMQGGIGELKDLANIEGRLGITGLERIDDIVHAKDANLKSKHRLRELILAWTKGRATIDERMEEMVLESLQPHPNLTHLEILDYGGARFPSWLGDPSFSKLKDVSLFLDTNQKTMVNLPSLGQLPSLDSLRIKGRFKIPRMVNFPSLTKLNFVSVDGLWEWGSIANDGFPCLRQLGIESCPNLMRLVTVPSLKDINIRSCESLTSLILCIDGHPSMLQRLEIEDCSQLTSVVGLHKLDYLEELEIGYCPLLQLPQEEPLPPKLRKVQLEDCLQLASVVGLHKLDYLEELEVVRCWKLTSLAGLQVLTSLKSLHLERCPKLQLHPNECLQSVPDQVGIIDCPRLMEWCKTHQFRYIQEISAQEALTVSDFYSIPSDHEVENTPSLKYLYIRDAEDWPSTMETARLPSTLETLEFLDCEFSGSLFLHQNLSVLKRLKIDSCWWVGSVVGLSKLHSLEELEIGNCPELQLPREEPVPPKLEAVRIDRCQELTSLAGLQDLTSLRSLFLKECPKLQLHPNESLRSVPDEVEIIDCPTLMKWCRTHQFTYTYF